MSFPHIVATIDDIDCESWIQSTYSCSIYEQNTFNESIKSRPHRNGALFGMFDFALACSATWTSHESMGKQAPGQDDTSLSNKGMSSWTDFLLLY